MRKSRLATLCICLQILAPLAIGAADSSSKPASSQPRPALPFDGDSRLIIHRDVVYGSVEPANQDLDAYLVKSDKPTPVVIELHGGAWFRGNKNSFATYGGHLVKRMFEAGISVVTARYRLTGKHPFPEPMEDAARVVQFVRSKAKEWNLDPTRVALMGSSAGAHLSAYTALNNDQRKPDSADPVERESSRVRCFLDFLGPMDFTMIDVFQPEGRQGEEPEDAKSNAYAMAFAMTMEQLRSPEGVAKGRKHSPLYLVTPDDPPVFASYISKVDLSSRDHKPAPKSTPDVHDAWFGVLLCDAMDKVGVEAIRNIGPWVTMADAEGRTADAAMKFLEKHLVGE